MLRFARPNLHLSKTNNNNNDKTIRGFLFGCIEFHIPPKPKGSSNFRCRVRLGQGGLGNSSTRFCSCSSSVSLSSFIPAVPMHKCFGKLSHMNSNFSTAILNGPCCLLVPGSDFVLVGECHYTKDYDNNDNYS